MKCEDLLQLCVIVLTSMIATVQGVRCIQCSQAHFHGEPGLDDCYKLEDSFIVNKTNCVISEPDAYCFTRIELSDGIMSYLERGCTTPKEDTLHATDEYPDSEKCTTGYQTSGDSYHIQQTECYMPCKSDKCNGKQILNSMKSCPEACPANSECNYLTGKCQCAPKRDGANCSSIEPITYKSRTCLQCNSKTDPGCANMTAGTKCQNGETHCSTAQTWILKPDGTFDNVPVVTRSCTSRYLSPDRCYLTKTGDIEAAKYTEYTCVSTCSTDNCNTGTANGVVDEEFIPMKCVVCEGGESSCGPGRKLTTDCPVGTTHCKATVTYWETIITDSKLEGRMKPEPSVSVRSIKRECSSKNLAPKCTTKRVRFLNLKEVTCEETCMGDGCNTGWPARPKCISCNNVKLEGLRDDECLYTPPPAHHCPGPHHQYCYTYLRNNTIASAKTEADSDKYTITRGCSTYRDGTAEGCRNITEYGRHIGVECTDYCSESDCNYDTFDYAFTPVTETPRGYAAQPVSTLSVLLFAILCSTFHNEI